MSGGNTVRKSDGVIRILHIVDSLGAGGMENGVVNVATRLEGRADVWVATLREEGAFRDRMPVPAQVFSLGKGVGYSMRAARRLGGAIRRLEPDVVHTHNLGPLIYTKIASLVGAPRLFPTIVHGEHSMLEGGDLRLKRVLQRRFLYRSCAIVHSVSAGLQSALLDLGLKCRRMEVILNGVDGSRFRPGPAEGGQANESDPVGGGFERVLGIVGRLVVRKRHEMLIEAFGRLADRDRGLSLLIVGDQGPEKERIREVVRSHRHRNRIQWVPFQMAPEKFYGMMDLLVVPSESEGLANVVLEAMACGVPVAGSLACGTPEVVEDGVDGFLGEIRSSDDLEELIERALRLSREDRVGIGRKARAKVLSHFTLERMAETYWTMYQSVLKK